MTEQKIPSIARMRKRHAPKQSVAAKPGTGRRLVEAQSFRDALLASLIVIIVFSMLWAMLSTLMNRVWPWMTMLLGILLGLAIRRAGRGLDWRFPVLAAAAALVGSLVGNFVVSAAFTARALETTTLAVLRNVTVMTWPVFFEETLTPADLAYAFIAAGIAAYYANRRLTRAEYRALRQWKDGRGS